MKFIEVIQDASEWYRNENGMLALDTNRRKHLVNVDMISEIYPIVEKDKGIDMCRIVFERKDHYIDANESYEEVKKKINATKKAM